MKKLVIIILLVLSITRIYAESLPKDIKWETNNDEPIFSGYTPQKGGTYYNYITSYPQTFRLYGPNSNSGAFVSYNRKWAFMSLVTRHDNNFKYIPALATHWSVQPDQKTVYYKLDQSAKWSDGKAITADDYVFTYQFMQSPHIQDPFYNQFIRDHFAAVVAIDKYTLKIELTKPSWKILDEADLTPLPKHVIKLDKNWVLSNQWTINVVPGPYVISEFKKGKSVTFKRINNWWGENKKYYKNKFNFDFIKLEIIQTQETAYEQFKKGNLSLFVPSALIWTNKTNIDQINNGYIVKRRIFIDSITGARGIFFNSQDLIWKDEKLRQAFAYTIDFENLNKNIFNGLFDRKSNFFDSLAPYNIAGINARPFDLAQAAKLLTEAGWQINPNTGIREKNNQVLQLTITTGSDEALKYLPYIKQIALNAGIEVIIQKLDGAQFFDLVNDLKYQSIIISFGGGLFPDPRQFLHTENMKAGTNNLFNYGNKLLDEQIAIYEFDLNEQKRVEAIKYIETEIVNQALYLPFWEETAERLLYWRYIKGPNEFVTITGFDVDYLYYDAAAKKELDQALKDKKTFTLPEVNYDPYKKHQQ